MENLKALQEIIGKNRKPSTKEDIIGVLVKQLPAEALVTLAELLDVKDSFQQLVSFVADFAQKIKELEGVSDARVTELRSMYIEALQELKNLNIENFNTLKGRMQSKLDEEVSAMKQSQTNISNKIYSLENKVSDIESTLPNKDEIIDEALSKFVKDSPEQIRDGLESLPKGKKLSIQAIEDLSDILEELRKKKGGGLVGGGGMNAIPLHFIDDETPSGTKNGSNTDFTTNLIPATGSLKVYRNGVRQRVTEDYTLSGQTISFTVAPASDEIILCDYRT